MVTAEAGCGAAALATAPAGDRRAPGLDGVAASARSSSYLTLAMPANVPLGYLSR